MNYECSNNSNTGCLIKKDIMRIILFHTDSKMVEYSLLSKCYENGYESPAEAIYEENHFWIPFHYTLKLMDSDIFMDSQDVVYILKPNYTVNSCYSNMIGHEAFCDVKTEFGTSDIAFASAHLVNLFNGVLKIDPMSIGQLGLNTLFWVPEFNSSFLYDEKYSTDVAMMFCSQSQDEIRGINDGVSNLYNLLYQDGSLGSAISNLRDIRDADVDYWANCIESIKATSTKTNPRTISLNSAYENLDSALKKQSITNNMTSAVTGVQENFQSKLDGDFLTAAKVVVDIFTYSYEINTVDAQSVECLSKFSDYAKNNQTFISDASIKAINNVVNQSKTSYGREWYTLGETFQNNMNDIIGLAKITTKAGVATKTVSLDQALFGAEGVLILAAWDVASKTIPWIKDGIEGSTDQEMALYAEIMEIDSYNWFQDLLWNKFDAKNEKIKKDLAASLYTYLKYCYITRSIAINASEMTMKHSNLSYSDKQMVNNYLASLKQKNEQIASHLDICLKAASGEREAFGFTITDSEEFLELSDDSYVISKVIFNSINNNNINNDKSKDNNTSVSIIKDNTYRDIVLVLDTSGSMEGTPFSNTIDSAKDFVLQVAGGNTRVGIVSYDTNAHLISQLSNNVSGLMNDIDGVSLGDMTNMYSGLSVADDLLKQSSAEKKIIILMSDGLPNESPNVYDYSYEPYGDEVVEYATKLKDKGYYIYTLGFFQNLSGEALVYGQDIMNKIAGEGYYYDINETDSINFFFNDVATDIAGQHSILVKIACPVDVYVTFNGETLTSDQSAPNNRTSFGSISYTGEYDEVKNVRLLEGANYDIVIRGTGEGTMTYSISYPDDSGAYTDVRTFEDIPITDKTVVETNTKKKRKTVVKLDSDGDGRTDVKYQAVKNGTGEVAPDYTNVIVVIAVLVALGAAVKLIGLQRIKKLFTVKTPMTSPIPLSGQSVVAGYCGNCGGQLESGGSFCPHCGFDNSKVMMNTPQNSSSNAKFCGNCGHTLSSEAVYCDNCGHDTREDNK